MPGFFHFAIVPPCTLRHSKFLPERIFTYGNNDLLHGK